ncbi:MAG: hypothetical protein AABW80_03140 [Nanoarchaeota archaeon]
MAYAYIIPEWFFGLDITLEIIFGLITLLVSIFAFNIYKTSKERSIGLLSLSFLFISLSYLTWAFVNLVIAPTLVDKLRIITLGTVPKAFILAIYTHYGLFILGLVTLAYTTFQVKKIRIYYVLSIISILVVVVSVNKLITSRIVSAFLLFFITYHYFKEWRNKRNKRALWIFGSFFLLTLGSIDFIFSANFYATYVIGHILEFGAYSLILGGLIHLLRKTKIR